MFIFTTFYLILLWMSYVSLVILPKPAEKFSLRLRMAIFCLAGELLCSWTLLHSWKNQYEFLGSRSRSCINPGEKQQMRGISCSGEAPAFLWGGCSTVPRPRRWQGVGETPSKCYFNLPYSRLCLQWDPSTSPQLVWHRYFIFDTSALFFQVLLLSPRLIQFPLLIRAGSWQNKLLHTYNYKNKRKTSEKWIFCIMYADLIHAVKCRTAALYSTLVLNVIISEKGKRLLFMRLEIILCKCFKRFTCLRTKITAKEEALPGLFLYQ